METLHLILTALSLGGMTALHIQSRARDQKADERNQALLDAINRLGERFTPTLARASPVSSIPAVRSSGRYAPERLPPMLPVPVPETVPAPSSGSVRRTVESEKQKRTDEALRQAARDTGTLAGDEHRTYYPPELAGEELEDVTRVLSRMTGSEKVAEQHYLLVRAARGKAQHCAGKACPAFGAMTCACPCDRCAMRRSLLTRAQQEVGVPVARIQGETGPAWAARSGLDKAPVERPRSEARRTLLFGPRPVPDAAKRDSEDTLVSRRDAESSASSGLVVEIQREDGSPLSDRPAPKSPR